MATCDNCESTIVFGGKKEGAFRYCSKKCYEKGYVQAGLATLPAELVEREVKRLHQGACPECGGPGPVDIHNAHKIWSVVYLSCSSTKPFLCCRACGRKKQIIAALFCFFAGWWSLHGLFLTPLQILANIKGIIAPPNPQSPSVQLQKIARIKLAADLAAVPSPGAPAPMPEPISLERASKTATTTSANGPFSDIGKPLG